MMPGEAARKQALEAIRQEVGDVFDWDRAEYPYGKVLIYYLNYLFVMLSSPHFHRFQLTAYTFWF